MKKPVNIDDTLFYIKTTLNWLESHINSLDIDNKAQRKLWAAAVKLQMAVEQIRKETKARAATGDQ